MDGEAIVSVAVPVLVGAALLAAALAVLRLARGPTQADRVIALDLLMAVAVVLCIAAALASGSTGFLDVALVLALVGFIGTVGWARVVERAGPR
jgi:multicomponent Na+:H+ antiporter subunit F